METAAEGSFEGSSIIAVDLMGSFGSTRLERKVFAPRANLPNTAKSWSYPFALCR